MPIYGQIQSFGLTNVLVVIVRFFGGVKLGVGGLIAAYREAARMTLEASDIVEKTIDIHFRISFGYADMNRVMRVIREKNLDIVSQKMDMDCEIIVATRKQYAESTADALAALFGITSEKL